MYDSNGRHPETINQYRCALLIGLRRSFTRFIRTIRYLKLIQILNRIQRKVWKPRLSLTKFPFLKPGLPQMEFPAYFDSWDGADGFTFLNESHQIQSAADWNNAAWLKLWLYNLHYFDCLRQKNRATGQSESTLILRWIQDNPPTDGSGWEPYPLSLRIVNWIKWRLAGYGELSPEMIESLALQTRFLRGQLEYHLLANHLLANAKALIFAGRLFQGTEADGWFEKGWSLYQQQLPEQILPDGSHFERSVMYHAIILEDLLDVFSILPDEDKRIWLCPFVERMLGFLVKMTGPDGRIALFNDAAWGIAQEPAVLLDYAARLGFRIPALDEVLSRGQDGADYIRMSSGDLTLFSDVGAIGPDYQPGHAHADTLSFELFEGRKRLMVDTGTSCYGVSAVRLKERGTAAHNTVRIDGRDSSEVWSGHRVGQRARIVRRVQAVDSLTACHDGYRPLLHERTWRWLSNGLSIHDRLEGSGRHSVEIFFHFHPDIKVEQTALNAVKLNDKWTLHCSKGQVTVVDSHWSSEFGKRVPCKVAVIRLSEVLPCEVVSGVEFG